MNRKLTDGEIDLIRDALDWYGRHLTDVAGGLEQYGQQSTADRYRARSLIAADLDNALRRADLYMESES